MIRIRTSYHAETDTKPERVKAWVAVRGVRQFLSVPYDRSLRVFGEEAPFREAAEQLARQCDLGLVGESFRKDRGYMFKVTKESEDQVQNDPDDHQDQQDDEQRANGVVHGSTVPPGNRGEP